MDRIKYFGNKMCEIHLKIIFRSWIRYLSLHLAAEYLGTLYQILKINTLRVPSVVRFFLVSENVWFNKPTHEDLMRLVVCGPLHPGEEYRHLSATEELWADEHTTCWWRWDIQSGGGDSGSLYKPVCREPGLSGYGLPGSRISMCGIQKQHGWCGSGWRDEGLACQR